MNTENISKEDLYLKHVRKVCDFIETKYPEISVLMWDDQLRYLTSEGMLNELSNLKTTPVVWQYDTDVFDKLGPSLWNQYAKFFPKVWIASSFKGAVGENEYIVNVGHYIQNHHSWINVLENYKYLINFEAVIITGWQRYDHFSVLCELLPVALPSLIMNMKILEAKEETPLRSPKEVAEILKCQQPYALMGLSFGTPRCSYPGSEILENVYHLHQLAEDFKHLEKNSVFKGWMSSFHMYYNISNPEYIFKVASQLDHLQNEINDIEKDMSAALLDVYDVFTANEWIYTYIKPLRKQISELVNTKDRLLAKNIWPRRPFNENYPKENQS
ncbi:hypothetical protein HHI36_008509 [Cryptolaemus montrouzieri]|uniref:Hexosaminidase D n=1 Tax=Cryptolaemus montrouzieri TaxID=559131 RepID=A0ABD2MSM5_9CUCU